MISANRNDALPIPMGARLNIVRALNYTEIKIKNEKKSERKSDMRNNNCEEEL